MEHICFKAQLCINISNFHQILHIHILINLCLGTSLTVGSKAHFHMQLPGGSHCRAHQKFTSCELIGTHKTLI